MAVREDRIPMPDGAELAVTLYLPPDAGAPPVPALLEYLPYRKDDAMLARDHDLYSYLAARGYAGARVDIRGTGASSGQLPDGEYTEVEQGDAEQAIAWLASQPWCTGAVGMWGISWGGFNAIQVALRRPPALKAIIAVDASDDLFHDDVHYIDGLPHIDEYALMIDHMNALPPAPEFRLDEGWQARAASEPWLAAWLAQNQDGPYWRRASLRPDYHRLTVPTFLIGGWLDGYRDSIPRMLAAAAGPVKALIGPWNHTFPHNASPGPAIEWRAEAVRWWDHWLKGAENGIMAEPPVAVYVRHWHPPGVDLAEVPGRWRAETALPPLRTRHDVWHCGPGRTLTASPPGQGTERLPYLPSAGVEAGHWWGELAADQRGADACSLVFDSPPLEEDIEILGAPLVEICGSADAEPLHWFARLCDVAPDGAVTLVTGAGRATAPDLMRYPAVPGGLGGGQAGAVRSASPGPGDRADAPKPADGPGPADAPASAGTVFARLPLGLHVTSWVFPRGHRIRLALSNAMWPMIWPTPRPATATVWLGPGRTRLALPVVPHEPRPEPAFPPPTPATLPPGVETWGEMLPVHWTHTHDDAGAHTVTWRGFSGSRFRWGKIVDEEYLRYDVCDSRPAVASAHGEARTEIHLRDRLITAQSTLDVTSNESALRYRFRREFREDGVPIRAHEWERVYPRRPH